MTRWAWGLLLCSRCDHGSLVVVEQTDVPRIGGLQCAHCGAMRASWTYRGKPCATEAEAKLAAEAWQSAALNRR